MTSKSPKSRTHFVIPDTQVKPGVPLDHLYWIGQYAVDRRPDVIVHLGDHADMESLSSYDRGTMSFEGRRYNNDIEAANRGFAALNDGMVRENQRLARNKKALWEPEKYLTLGNHENRIWRAIERQPELHGAIGVEDLNYEEFGWKVSKFLEVIEIDGVAYSHYFYNPLTGNPYTGTAENMLKNVGRTFTMGHRQTFVTAVRYVGNKQIRALVAGACYLHEENYKGPQGNHHWRGILVKHEVEDGQYNLMEVSLDYLCRRYEGKSLEKFTAKKY